MWGDTNKWGILFLIRLLLPVMGDATEKDFLRLYDKLLGNYTRHARPLKNQTSAMAVTLQFDLISLSGLNDVKQRLSALVLLSVQWHDKNLVWDPEEYGGIDRMYLNGNQIWTPRVYIHESAARDPTLFSLPTTHLAQPAGNVTFGSTGIIEAACRLDVMFFPYDHQDCRFVFGVLDSSRQDVVLEADPRRPQKSSSYVEDGEWRVLSFETTVKYLGIKNYEMQTLHIMLKLQRRSTYYVLNVIIPAMTVSLLSLLTFAVPVDSGERLQFCLSILLSLSVYVTYIGGIMPSSAIDMPIILRYLVCLFLISSLCVVITVVVICVRWSRVVVLNDQQKRIFIFGIPITVRRRRPRFDALHRSINTTQLTEKSRPINTTQLNEKNRPINTTQINEKNHDAKEISSVCSGQLQSFCKSSRNVLVHPSSKGNLGNKGSPISWLQKGGQRSWLHKEHRKPSMIEQMTLCRKSLKRNPKARQDRILEADVVNAGLDVDILYICYRLDIGTFLLIVIFYLAMTIHTFVQLNTEITE